MSSVASLPKRTGSRRTLLIVAGMTGVLFIAVEGLSSSLLFIHDLVRYSRRPLTERAHSRYDPLLGWINLPNLDLPDLYGPGTRFRTNSQGFRGDREFTAEVPRGKTRIICLGDSFTLGYGVGDDQAWCQVLQSLEPRLETVNMGQGGYGMDQDYLWYLRDGTPLSTDILVLAFITEDFYRIARDNFLGYAKPVLEVEDDRLVPRRVPVPRHAYYFPWVTQNAAIFTRLRSVELFDRILGLNAGGNWEPTVPDVRKTLEIASRIFHDLQNRMREKGGILVLVYLPVSQDYAGHGSDPWRDFVRQDAGERGIPFIDLVEEFRKLPADRAAQLFQDHYSAGGNRFVAQSLCAKLLALPPAAQRIARLSAPQSR